MIEERMLARDPTLAHALLAHEGAHARPREEDLVERGAGERVTCLVLEVADVLFGRHGLARVAAVIGVRRPDDRCVPPRQHEEEAAVALREEDVRLLRGASGDEVDPLREPEQWIGPPAERRDRAIEPRARRDDGEPRADIELPRVHGLADASADHAIALAQEI